MYSTFEEAKAAAESIIEKKYDGDKMDCVITETKASKRARKVMFSFHFHGTDTNGEFVRTEYGEYMKRTSI